MLVITHCKNPCVFIKMSVSQTKGCFISLFNLFAMALLCVWALLGIRLSQISEFDRITIIAK